MNKQNSPLDWLVVIVGKQKGEEVSKSLNEMGAVFYLNTIGHGTAESGVADIFGFGVVERDVVFGIVPSSQSEEIIQNLNDKFKFEEQHTGLSFTVPINSVERKLVDLLKKGGQNDKKI